MKTVLVTLILCAVMFSQTPEPAPIDVHLYMAFFHFHHGLTTWSDDKKAKDPGKAAAEARFRQTDSEYWQHWCSSGFGYEVYRDWLDSLTQQISDELASIWKGRSEVTNQWFQGTCAPAIDNALAILVKQRIAQARDVATKRLEGSLSKPRTGIGNPVADEILARANDPESMRSLIENGDDSLSPPAQRAIQLARIRMKAESPDALIDIYLSDQWRIHGGPRKKSVREELRDRLIPVIIKAFGSVESSLHVLLKESPCSNGRGIQTFIHACELFFLRIRSEALEANDHVKAEYFAKLGEEFRELCEFEREYVGTGAGPGEEIHATLRTDVSDTERSSDMVVFGSSSQVTIVRASGTPEELRWDTYMGGDFATTALFQPDDRVVTGDEIYSELFDEPRVVARVVPVLASRQVAYWKATIMPRSEWSRHWPVGPNRIASSTKGATPESEKTATLPRKESQPEPAGGETRGRKGDVTLLKKTDESFYQSVDFPTAETYAGISPRRRQQLMTEGVLTVVGMGQSRRITVESLMAICPPVEDTK